MKERSIPLLIRGKKNEKLRTIVGFAFATTLLCVLALTGAFSGVEQTSQDDVVKATRNWLTNCTKGDRVALNASMDGRFIATTPAGDVLPKERLVPDDPSQAVQRLPAMEREGALVRLYGTTAVLMGRLHSKSIPSKF